MLNINQKKCLENASLFDGYFMQRIHEGLSPCFSVAVLKNDEIVFDFAKGKPLPESDSHTEITDQTLFNIGSVTKPLTGALIIKLVEMGEITLNDPVKKYIREYKFDNVTIYHLLTHTSGYDGNYPIDWPKKDESIEGYFKKIFSIDFLKHKTGEAVEYCTYGYSILMYILEKVTNMSIEQYSRNVLFDPLGMNFTTYETNSLIENEYILPYNDNIKSLEYKLNRIPATGDSGLYSTPMDLLKFSNMVLHKGEGNGKRVFSEAAIQMMLREITNRRFMRTPNFWLKASMDIHGCFGDLSSPSTVGHTGFSGCMLFIDPEFNMAGAILTNSMKLHEDWKNYKRICNLLYLM